MNANPYASPAVAAAAVDAPAANVELFTPNQVGGASFLGTPLAGASLIALNELRLGRPGQAAVTFGLGLIAMVVVAVVSVLVLSAVPASIGTVIGIGYMYAMRQIAHFLHGAEVEAHTAAGGPAGSLAEAAGITILGLGTAVMIIVVLVLVTP